MGKVELDLKFEIGQSVFAIKNSYGDYGEVYAYGGMVKSKLVSGKVIGIYGLGEGVVYDGGYGVAQTYYRFLPRGSRNRRSYAVGELNIFATREEGEKYIAEADLRGAERMVVECRRRLRNSIDTLKPYRNQLKKAIEDRDKLIAKYKGEKGEDNAKNSSIRNS